METFEQFKSATTAKGFDASELLGICRTKKNMAPKAPRCGLPE
jgi:hypothetical protein